MMHGSYDIPEEGPSSKHPNCRCMIVFIPEWDWLVELDDTMDRVIGDTTPLIPEFKREYVGILNA
jgi:hypothetical protein